MGKKNGRLKWEAVKARLKKRRGDAGLQRLLDEMNKSRQLSKSGRLCKKGEV